MAKREVYEKGLKTLGWKRDWGARTNRYLVYLRPDCAYGIKAYLGRSGAFRLGTTIADSKPVNTHSGFYKSVIDAATPKLPGFGEINFERAG